MKYLLLLGLVIALPANAQTPANPIEVSPFVGYLFGGSFAHIRPDSGWTGVSIANQVDFGVRVGYRLNAAIEPEIQWTRSENTKINLESPTEDPWPSFPLIIDYVLAGASYNFSSGCIRPYASLDLGVARLANIRQEDWTHFALTPSTNFAGSLGLGVKAFITPQFGIRVEARGYASQVPQNFFITCFGQDSGGASFPVSCGNKWILNSDLTAGIVVAF